MFGINPIEALIIGVFVVILLGPRICRQIFDPEDRLGWTRAQFIRGQLIAVVILEAALAILWYCRYMGS